MDWASSTLEDGVVKAEGPVEPKVLVEAVRAEDWGRVVEVAKADWVSLICDHLDTLRWMYGLMPAEVVETDRVIKAGRDLIMLMRAGQTPVDRFPDDPAELAGLVAPSRPGTSWG